MAWQVLQRRSLGEAASGSPLLLQLNAQHLAAAAGGRLLRCMPLPAGAPAAAGQQAPVVPQLAAVSPSCLILPPMALEANQPAVLALWGRGLWTHSGRPGLVLARQQGAPPPLHAGYVPLMKRRCCSIHPRTCVLAAACLAGRHLPVEVWGSSAGSSGGGGALIVSVLGLRPGVCELEVQRGSVLGTSMPLLVLPAGLEAMAAELHASHDGSGAAGGSSAALMRDLGTVVAWVERREQLQPAVDVLYSGIDYDTALCSSDSEEEALAGPAAEAAQHCMPPPPADVMARLAHHAAAYSLGSGWAATAAALESAASAAQAAAEKEVVATAAATLPTVPPPGWQPGDILLQRDEHALDFRFVAPLLRRQLQHEEGQPVPPAGLGKVVAGWQAAAGEPAAPAGAQLPVARCSWAAAEANKIGRAAEPEPDALRRRSMLVGWGAALLVVLSTAIALHALRWMSG